MTEQTVILAGTQADAAAIAERLGLTYEQWVTPHHDRRNSWPVRGARVLRLRNL